MSQAKNFFSRRDRVEVYDHKTEPPADVTVLRDTGVSDGTAQFIVRCGSGWAWNEAPEPYSDRGDGVSWRYAAKLCCGKLVVFNPTTSEQLQSRIRSLETALKLASPNTPRGTLLSEASDLIHGDRNKTYGKPTENFDRTAALWNVQLGHKLRDGEKFTAADVALLMVQLKMARTVTQPKRDNLVDAVGYLACGWECMEDERGDAA